MNRTRKIAVLAALTAAMATLAIAQAVPAKADATFEPFQQWRRAVLAGNADALKALYSSDPAAKILVKGVTHDADADISFWLALKPKTMKVQIVRNEPRHDHISVIFRADVVSGTASGQSMSLTEDQSWKQQGDQWRLISVERTDSPRLTQPADMKKNIYPASADAHLELKEAEEKAAAGHKRILLVFGANWCFDCHVLDLAFRRPELAPILVANYELLHIDLGPEEEKNADLVRQYEIPLDKGIPALAVADSDGKLVVSQKSGEFEDARGLTPEVLREFLEKWKPAAR